MTTDMRILEMICDALDEYAEKDKLSASDLEVVHKLVLTKEKLLKAEMLEGELGYSDAGEWEAKGSYNKAHSYADKDTHYVRGHYSHKTDRYSYDDGMKMIVDKMDEMMHDDMLPQGDKTALKKARDMLVR